MLLTNFEKRDYNTCIEAAEVGYGEKRDPFIV
jgi:hypothetical protein